MNPYVDITNGVTLKNRLKGKRNFKTNNNGIFFLHIYLFF